ncbi:hypothetical protein RI049_14715 [Cedecea neteri]|uniref:CDI toxin immunity protein n=1 Tax=Cedecea neteri TaxID=158822 RepID=UPI002AA8EB86|nr:hypothetical protein [Cedecea neteri]WPU21332.1 hypothetical protein RI049_14715 [Cedecea neteri]
MRLFEECRAALKADFTIVEGEQLNQAMGVFHQYPWQNGDIAWSKMDFIDYEIRDTLLSDMALKDMPVFVITDDADIPVFKTQLSLIISNSYDVMALSPKLFIFNEQIMMKLLFPHDVVRVGINRE